MTPTFLLVPAAARYRPGAALITLAGYELHAVAAPAERTHLAPGGDTIAPPPRRPAAIWVGAR